MGRKQQTIIELRNWWHDKVLKKYHGEVHAPGMMDHGKTMEIFDPGVLEARAGYFLVEFPDVTYRFEARHRKVSK